MIAVAEECARRMESPTDALVHLLDELEIVLMDVPGDTYQARLLSNVSGSVGEHVRHLLDYVSALVAADPSTPLTYDARRRGTIVEADPGEAVRQILNLKIALDIWATRPLEEPIYVSSLVARGEQVTGWSTLARELAFVVSHTIHHQAMIGVLLAVHGHGVSERFGYAPSTPTRH